MTGYRIIVMGVSGCGKSSIGAELAQQLGITFIEGDMLHPSTNVAKMSAGIPLTDEARWPWLDAVGKALRELNDGVASCSALKRGYRDRLRAIVGPSLRFVFLDLDRTELTMRLQKRAAHFMPTSLLDSQLATLERPHADESDILVLGGKLPPPQTTGVVVSWVKGRLAQSDILYML